MTQDINNENEQGLQEGDIITLLDEDDKEVAFEFVDALVVEDNEYVVLAPESDVEEGEVVIMRVEQDEDGNDVFINAEDEEAQKVFDIFVSQEDDYEVGDAE